MKLFVALCAGAASAGASSAPPTPDQCAVLDGVDIDPHTPGMGSLAAGDIAACCATCSSPEWWGKGW